MDPFPEASLSPAGFYHSQPSSTEQSIKLERPTQPTLASNIPGPGPRNYKSRKYRPCDFCRARQVACKIEVSPPCQLCKLHGRDCTFVERPKKKRRPKANATSTGQSMSPVSSAPDSGITGQIDRFTLASQESSSAEGYQRSFPPYTQPLDPHLTALSHDQDHSHTAYQPHFDGHMYDRRLGHNQYIAQQEHSLSHVAVSEFHRATPGLPGSHTEARPRPLSARPMRLVGETGEVNPYLLRCYHYDEQDECTVSRQNFRRVKKIPRVPHASGVKDAPDVVFALTDGNHASLGEPRVDNHTLSQFQHEVNEMFSDEQRFRLLGLYFRFIDPYFPIFARSDLLVSGGLSNHAVQNLPLSVSASLYAAALPFVQYDDHLSATMGHGPDHSQHLYRISWLALTQEAHQPSLSSIQAALLILQRPPSDQYCNETPWNTGLIAWTVSLAYVLGLNRDGTEWNIPVWELALRKRLWHAIVSMDKWATLGAGMPSHIRCEDVDVQPLWPHDSETSQLVDAEYHFRLLTDLTTIVSDITDTFFTVRASERTSKDFVLSFDRARPLRLRLRHWSDAMAPYQKEGLEFDGSMRMSGDHALRLAFIVANMTLLRAILRPVENMSSTEMQDHATRQNRMAARSGALECAKEAVDFVEVLGRPAMEAFWHSCRWMKRRQSCRVLIISQGLVPTLALRLPFSCSSFSRLTRKRKWPRSTT